MSHFLRTSDAQAGLLYLVLAAGTCVAGRNYEPGTAADMGSGYFPLLLSLLLGLLGLASLARGARGSGPLSERPQLRGLAIISTAIVLFAALTPALGLIITLPFLALSSASASRSFKLGAAQLALAGVLTGFCILVFAKGLHLSMPVFGSLFGG